MSPELHNGTYRLEVRAEDSTGVGVVVSSDFAVAIPLVTEWVTKPTGPIAGSAVAATFRSDLATRFECQLDGGGWAACGAGTRVCIQLPRARESTGSTCARSMSSTRDPEVSTTFTLGDPTGADLAGSVVSGPVAGSTIVFGVGGVVVVGAGGGLLPGGAGPRRRPVEPDLHVGVRLRADAVSVVGAGLADGLHTLRVQARSVGGAFGPITTHTFTVNTASQTTVSVVSGPVAGSTIVSAWAGLSWSAPGADCFRAELDQDGDLSNQACMFESGYLADAVSGGCAGLADGLHTLRVQARSVGGAFGPLLTHTFTVNTASQTTVSVVSGPVPGSTIVFGVGGVVVVGAGGGLLPGGAGPRR